MFFFFKKKRNQITRDALYNRNQISKKNVSDIQNCKYCTLKVLPPTEVTGLWYNLASVGNVTKCSLIGPSSFGQS